MKYELNDRPGAGPMLLYGLQWWAISLPCLVIMGVVASRLHHQGLGEQAFYLQKLFALTGLITVIQVILGHRLPLVVGPATVLLVGLTASLATDPLAVRTALMVGGGLMALAAATGLVARLRVFFTTRLVAVVLLLIALTLAPTILRLTLSTGDRASARLVFTGVLVLILVILNRRLPGVWKSLTVLLGLAGGSLAYFLVFGWPEVPGPIPSAAGPLFPDRLAFQAGPVLAFLFCLVALALNELSSIEAVGHMLKADDMPGRVRRGMFSQGLANLAAGALGVIGPVSFALSAGVIAGTGCAARRTMIPAGIGLFVCAFFPRAVMLFTLLPETVMGALMLYLMAGQLASSLAVLLSDRGVAEFSGGLTVGLPLMVGLVVSFAPPAAFTGFPELIRPLAANGFVMGLVTAIFLEHVVFRAPKPAIPLPPE